LANCFKVYLQFVGANDLPAVDGRDPNAYFKVRVRNHLNSQEWQSPVIEKDMDPI
jgi:hypothetical protein